MEGEKGWQCLLRPARLPRALRRGREALRDANVSFRLCLRDVARLTFHDALGLEDRCESSRQYQTMSFHNLQAYLGCDTERGASRADPRDYRCICTSGVACQSAGELFEGHRN